MIALYDQIQELMAELRGCAMTGEERAQAQAELTRARAEQAELDRAFEAQFAEWR
jgi:septal ring factor EnvC (AmiA/AmiB activator)